MNASELSEQIRQQVEAGEWPQAMASLAGAWNEASEFGTVTCSLPDYPGVWVRFATRGYPFSLRRAWEEAKGDDAVLSIILPRILAWSVVDVDGLPLPLPPDGERPTTLLDNIDDAVVIWMIRAFWRFWRIELPVPRKN